MGLITTYPSGIFYGLNHTSAVSQLIIQQGKLKAKGIVRIGCRAGEKRMKCQMPKAKGQMNVKCQNPNEMSFQLSTA
jgi:hypothetical protein